MKEASPGPPPSRQFVSLLTDHQEVIRSYIISQLPGSPDVRDILQETNIILWEKKDSFKIGTNFGAWACTVAHYKVLDYRKKKAKGSFLVFNDTLCESLAEESAERIPALLEAKRLALDDCISKLSPRNQELLAARYHSPSGDMKQLATQTGRSRGSLRVALARLRSTLRKCIDRQINLQGGNL